MNMLKRQLLSLIVSATTGLAPVVVLAEPPPDPPTNPTEGELGRAKELFENGKGLFAEGSYDAAIAAFRQAYALSGDPVLLYNIALAHDRAGEFDEALEYLGYYRAFAPESERAALSEKEDSLRKRQLRAQTDAEQNPDSETTNDGTATTSDESEPSGTDDSGTSDVGTSEPAKQKIFTVPVWIAAGVSVVGLGLGAGLGAAALGRSNDAEDLCGSDGGGTVCPAEAKSDADAARRMGIGADVALGVGAVAGVVAIVLIARNAVKRKKSGSSTTARLVPHRGGAGLQVRF